jgi:two-component system response regulator AtoC
MIHDKPTFRVLVVEDELLIRWSINETLTMCGYSVLEAPDGATAVRTLTESAPPIDVILLDYRLPDSKELALLATIRRLAPTTPVILMTAFGTPEIVEGAMTLGVSRVLNKPFDLHDLPAFIQDARVPTP